MNFNFILDENYLAYYILSTKMYNETKELENIKNKLNNDLGYKKILQKELLDVSIYTTNNMDLINEFISSKKFLDFYKHYENEPKIDVAIKILKGYIEIDDKELDIIKDNLWNKYRDSYQRILNIDFYNPTTILLDKDVLNTINYFKQTDEYKKLYNETLKYMNHVKKHWENKKNIINSFLKRVLKMDINLKLDVYISHPYCYEGFSFGENKIAWGHYNGIENPNYNLVYLVHEGMHHILPFTNDDNEVSSNIKHSIIELVSDYELNYFLNGENKLTQGHSYLLEYKKILYPYWLKYLGLNKDEIKKRLSINSLDLTIINDLDNLDIETMNIIEFNTYCINNEQELEKHSKKNK